MMALSLAACGGSDATTTTATTTTTTTTTTPTAVTLTLTTRVDDLTGGGAADTINGTTAGQLADGDAISGGAGSDTLDVTIANSTPAPTLTSVENIVIQSTHAGADFDFTNADTLVETITVTSSATALDLVAVQSNFDLAIDNSSGAVSVTFSDDHLASATAAFDIALDNSTSGVTVTSGGDDLITTLNVAVSGTTASSMALTMVADDGGDDDLTTLSVTGDGAVTLTEASTEFLVLTTLNFGGNSGGVTIDLDTNAADYTITGSSAADVITADQASTAGAGRTINLGAGNDTLNIGALAQAADTYTGGDGTDELIVTAAQTAAGTVGVSGFETLRLVGDIDQDMALLSSNSWTTIGIDGDGNFSNVPSAVTTLNLYDGFNADTDVALAVDGTADSMAVVMKEAVTATDLDIDEAETITIDSEFALTLTTQLSGTDLTSLTVSGDSAVDLSGIAAAALATIDASGLTAAAGFTNSSSTSAVAMTVTGNTAATGYTGALSVVTGSGDDTVTGTVNADTINTAGGNDVIVAGGGADQITGGAGSDTITLGTDAAAADVFLTSSNGTDTITGFDTAEDDIDVDGMVGTVNVVGITSSATAKTATFVADDVYVISDGSQAHGVSTSAASIADYTDLTDVALYLGFTGADANTGVTGTDLSAGDQLVFAINDLVGDKTYVYSFTEDGAAADLSTNVSVSAGELALIAVITEESGSALVAGDFV